MEAPRRAEVQSQLSSGTTLYVGGLQASLEAADVMDVPEVSYHRESRHPPRISGSGTKESTTLRVDDDDEEVSRWIGGDMPHTLGGQRQESPSDLNNSLRNIARIGVGVDPSSPINEAFAGKHSPSLQRSDVACELGPLSSIAFTDSIARCCLFSLSLPPTRRNKALMLDRCTLHTFSPANCFCSKSRGARARWPRVGTKYHNA
jgi:hypothetical protein